jgi:hypothetical protein
LLPAAESLSETATPADGIENWDSRLTGPSLSGLRAGGIEFLAAVV